MSNSFPANMNFVLSQLNRNIHFEGFDDVDLFRLMNPDLLVQAAHLVQHSTAQLRQDIFVAIFSSFKRDGYFVEVGATDGNYLSNSLLLEQQLGWRGILAEPARFWHKALYTTREAVIDIRCVHSHTAETVLFREVHADQALSTIVDYAEGDLHHYARRHGDEYAVQTVSLEDLLSQHGAPYDIDYLSIDTEGSELDILTGFDFATHRFGAISCEHNYTTARDTILRLLASKGYKRVLNHISLFDDWYVHESEIAALDAAFPAWRNVSDQFERGSIRPMSQTDKTIALLQKTVQDLITDRDAYKAVVEVQKPAELKAKDNEIATLQETVASLLKERDELKRVMLKS